MQSLHHQIHTKPASIFSLKSHIPFVVTLPPMQMDFPWQKKLKWIENLFGEEEKGK
jgi:hypothetical protein